MKSESIQEGLQKVLEEQKANTIKAFHVRYDLPSSSGHTVVVLVKGNQRIEEALEQKTTFRYHNKFCRIQNREEVPLSRVKLSELSVTEFFMLQGANI